MTVKSPPLEIVWRLAESLDCDGTFPVEVLARHKDDERCLNGRCKGDGGEPEGRLPLSTAASHVVTRAISLPTRKANCLGQLSHVGWVRFVAHFE